MRWINGVKNERKEEKLYGLKIAMNFQEESRHSWIRFYEWDTLLRNDDETSLRKRKYIAK